MTFLSLVQEVKRPRSGQCFRFDMLYRSDHQETITETMTCLFIRAARLVASLLSFSSLVLCTLVHAAPEGDINLD